MMFCVTIFTKVQWTVIPNVKEEDNYVGIPTRKAKFQDICPK